MRQDSTAIAIQVDAPYLHYKEYARRTGQSDSAVYRQCYDGKLPTRPRDNKRVPFEVNMALLMKQAVTAKY